MVLQNLAVELRKAGQERVADALEERILDLLEEKIFHFYQGRKKDAEKQKDQKTS